MKSLKGGGTEEIRPFGWEVLKKLIKDWSSSTQNLTFFSTLSPFFQFYKNWTNSILDLRSGDLHQALK